MKFSTKVTGLLFFPAILLGGYQLGVTSTDSGTPLRQDRPRESVAYELFRMNVVQGVETVEASPSGTGAAIGRQGTYQRLRSPVTPKRAILDETGADLIEKQVAAEYRHPGIDILQNLVRSEKRYTV
jgi:hypothetical protein